MIFIFVGCLFSCGTLVNLSLVGEEVDTNRTQYTKDEDRRLLQLAQQQNSRNWVEIARKLDVRFVDGSPVCDTLQSNRTPLQCLQRYNRSLNKQHIRKYVRSALNSMLFLSHWRRTNLIDFIF